jgi:hypothetical protein
LSIARLACGSADMVAIPPQSDLIISPSFMHFTLILLLVGVPYLAILDRCSVIVLRGMSSAYPIER